MVEQESFSIPSIYSSFLSVKRHWELEFLWNINQCRKVLLKAVECAAAGKKTRSNLINLNQEKQNNWEDDRK